MEREAIDTLLQQGMEAAKRGDRALAFERLHQVVEAEPENETAWLWLSAVVDGEDDKRLCLDNVLLLNPDNEAARRGLRRLATTEEGESKKAGEIIRRPVTPLTPAAAILYPERLERTWRQRDPVELQQATIATFSAQSRFDDVWQRDSDICAYCATEIDPDDQRCPGCGRKLQSSAFRYPKASSHLTIYWVLILGIAQISLALALVNFLGGGPPASILWQSLVFIVMVLLVVGLVLRQIWAYMASIVVLLMLLTTMILTWLLGPAINDSLAQITGREFFLVLGDKPYALFTRPMITLLRMLQYLAVPLALLYALFRVGPDFERVSERKVARLDRGISDASRYYGVGNDYAQRAMWASAVLHFQRAAALEPAGAFYQRALGEAYARLGYYERCLDVLESARQLTRDPETRAAIDQRIAEIGQLAAEERRQPVK